MSLPFFPNLSEMEFFGLSEMEFFGLSFEEDPLFPALEPEEAELPLLEDDCDLDWLLELELLLELLLELEEPLESFFPEFLSDPPEFLDSIRASFI